MNSIIKILIISFVISGSFGSQPDEYYLELLMVVDNGLYEEFGSNLTMIDEYCKEQVGVLKDVSFSIKFIL
jgi:hypothetical protein